jgi:hypothetical protein
MTTKPNTTKPENSTIKKPACYLIKHLTDYYKNHFMFLIKSPKPYQAIQKYYNQPFKIEKITERFPVLMKRVSYWSHGTPEHWMQEEEFRKIVTEIIHEHYTRQSYINKALAQLEEFINTPLPQKPPEKPKKPREKKYLKLFDFNLYSPYRNSRYTEGTVYKILKKAKEKYTTDYFNIYLFKESFAIVSEDHTIFIPYDIEKIPLPIPENSAKFCRNCLKTILQTEELKNNEKILTPLQFIVTFHKLST